MKELIFPMQEQFEEYLIDESKFMGYADSISFPENEAELIEIINRLREEGTEITIQGGKTGITGASVPEGGHILNLSHMNHVIESKTKADGTAFITVEAGITLMELQREIKSLFRKNPVFWPPDPTEVSASLGGIAAAGAQGISRLLYGKSQEYIEALSVIDYDGNKKLITRKESIVLSSGREIPFMDAVIGKEGISGVISDLKLRLVPKPESIWGITFFFYDSEEAAAFIEALKKDTPEQATAAIVAVEYMDGETIRLIESRKADMTKIKELPDVPKEVSDLLYVEIHGTEEAIEIIAEALMEVAAECGSDPDEAWAVSGESDVEKMHAFRHAAAETANLRIEEARKADSRITKLGTDMVIGEVSIAQILQKYRTDMATVGVKGCIFGHALENHLHVNIFPESFAEYQKGAELIRAWAKGANENQGEVFKEHGIGKLKREILGLVIPPEYISLCREIKEVMDCKGKFNKGNVFR